MTEWSYNSADLPISMKYPGGETVSYGYNARMLLDSLGSYVTGTTYDPAGRMTQRAYGNGTQTDYAYYPWNTQGGRLQQLSTGTLQDLSYSYDPAGNITQIVDTPGGETQQYGYDALNRLSSWRLNGSLSGLYAYDPFSGSLEAKGMLELDYGDPAHPQAVSAARAVQGASSEPGNPGTAGLAAWWSMDEAGGTRSDSQGGSVLDEHSGVPAVPGQQARAARFVPAGGGHLEAADSPELSLGDVDFTWVAQVYLESTPNTMLIAIKGERSVASQREFNLAYNLEAGGRFVFRVGNGSTTATVQSDVVQAGRWYTLVAWHDSQGNTLNLQVDNGTVYSTSYSGGSYDSSLPLSIGASFDGLNVLSGRVDEVALYKRLLTGDERAWLYNSGQGRSYGELVPGMSFTCPQGETCDQDQAAGQVVENSYGYDANGNQTTRVINGVTLTLGYDAEGYLLSVLGQGINAVFTYDGDGKRVKSTINGETTYFVGNHYEQTGTTITKYYYAGSQRVAMRTGSTVHYLLADHLGSTSLTVNSTGSVVSELRYTAWGSLRYQAGSTPTEYTYTGQYSDNYINLLDYGSRRFDPVIGRFIQPDPIVPASVQGIQAHDRYGYTNNNPVRFSDPSGHMIDWGEGAESEAESSAFIHTLRNKLRQNYLFSLIFRGSGPNGEWTTSDWKIYHKKRDNFWQHPDKWINPDAEKGWNLFALHASRLASHYSLDKKDDFVTDFALVFGGVPYSEGIISGTIASFNGPPLSFLNEGNAGLNQQYLDMHPNSNQSHHYAGVFYTAYFWGTGSAQLGNLVRDPNNPGDLALGNGAAEDALTIHEAGTYYNSNDLTIIGNLLLFYGNP